MNPKKLFQIFETIREPNSLLGNDFFQKWADVIEKKEAKFDYETIRTIEKNIWIRVKPTEEIIIFLKDHSRMLDRSEKIMYLNELYFRYQNNML